MHSLAPQLAPVSLASRSLDEGALRERLGIPAEAERVLIFGETSHWDPNWLHTSEKYYQLRIQHILDSVLDELERDPRRVFSLESVFFLKLYWERQPRRREALRRLVNQGRLKLTGSGVTTPDTLLPDTEAILRDYLQGQEWLREQGMEAEPRLAYLPDDFGHSPMLPAILRALGYEQAAITRIDGMYFVGCDYRRRSCFPLAGSSAELLLRQHRSLDFVWRSPDGSEVLSHWNAFTYFQGDMLAHLGVIRWMGIVFGIPWRGARHVARQVHRHVRRLEPLARTPYLFCPIGCDFNGPIHDLGGLLERFNRDQYERTGVWATSAGLDDYLDLVAHHRERLPVLELDPNPYWMGFYASRPLIKRTCNRIVRKLHLADKLAALEHMHGPGRAGGSGRARRALKSAWDLLVVSNHHDFITGTSPDRVFLEEQRPWLELCESHADSALSALAVGPHPPGVAPRPPAWRLEDGRLEVISPYFRLALDEAAGGCLTSYRVGAEGPELLAGPANDLVAYLDSGGLWRMGHEYQGGSFREVERASASRARLTVAEREGLLEVRAESELQGRPITRWLWIDRDSPVLRLRVTGAVRSRRTVCCRFPSVLSAETITMDVAGGILARPTRKLYDPTFWAARSFVHLQDQDTQRGLAAFLGGPAAASVAGDGALEWVAFRNAPRELAYGLLPVLAHPAGGSDGEEQALDYAVWFTAAGGFRENRLPVVARRVLRWSPDGSHRGRHEELADAALISDCPEVMVTALKQASRGTGLIARLESFALGCPEVRLHCPARPIVAARRCDARERDLEPLAIEAGQVVIPVSQHLSSVRLLFG